MKTSIRTIVIFIIITLITAGLTLARNPSTATTISQRPVRDKGESDEAFNAKLRDWEAEIRRITTADPNRPSTAASRKSIPERPVKQAGEIDASYNSRLRAWEAEVRSITAAAPEAIPERPVQRPGESDEAFRNRLITWEAEVRRINAKQKDAELLRLKQELETLKGSFGAGAYGVPFIRAATVSDNTLVIPMEEMKTEDILAINEDMNVMSRILINELNQKGITLPNYGSLSLGGVYGGGGMMSGYGSSYGATTGYGINLGFDTDALSSMYLQGYGLLFLMNVNFPLSAPPEAKEQPQETQETQKGEVDTVWQQTRQQIYQPQVASTTSTNTRGPDVKYDAQKIENLKTSLIKALKHAANIRALKSDESVILRIAGSGQTISILNVAQDGDNSIINYESNGIQQLVKISGDLDDYIKSLSAPTVILIRAKKSDIDSFAKGELDMEQFRQRVQIISYPLLKNTFQSATTTGRTTGTRRTDTGTTTSSTSRRGTTTTAVVPTQPTYETNN